jgi:hypothetical protein
MKAAAFVLLLCTASLFAQTSDPPISSNPLHRKGTWEIGVWVSGGHSVSGGISGVGIFSTAFRVGKVLTRERGQGWYRGNLEAVADVIPVTMVFQQTLQAPAICVPLFPSPCPLRDQTVYGGGFNPLITKWNFTAPKHFTPYVEIGGGLLFTRSDVPAFSSSVNFTPQIAFGVYLFRRDRQSLSFAGRYLHISNSGLGSLNPGINTIQFSLGYHWFR